MPQEMNKMAANRNPQKRLTFAEGVLIMVFILSACALQGVVSNCTLPDDLRGTWEDSTKGTLTFSNDSITGYSIYLFGTFTLTCYQQNGNIYIMESDQFYFFGLNFNGYFCWDITKVTDDLYYFYEYTAMLSGAGNEKVRMYLPVTARNYSDICSNTNPGLGTYRVLYKNQTLISSISTCPSVLQRYYTYTMTVGGTGVCTGDISLDVCDSTSYLRSDNENGNCSTPLGYSAGGELGCLISVSSGSMTYITVANTDSSVDLSTTYYTTCMIVDSSTSPYSATQYPKQCPDDMNATYVSSPGGIITMTVTGSCPTSSSSLLWLIAVVLILLLLIAGGMLCACYFYRRRKKQQEEEQRKKEEEERARALLEEGLKDDYNQDGHDGVKWNDGDGNSLSRGDIPPDVTIDFVPPQPKGVFRKHLEDLEDKPGFRSSGDVTPSGIRPTYDDPHKRFSKRRRVWMIGKDGKAIKVWKEEGDEENKDLNDSGMEDEDENGDSKDGCRFGGRYSGLSGKDKKEKDFFKQFGRQDVKESNELTDKGELKATNSKLLSKVKKMAVVRSFTKPLRRKARSRSKDSKAYKHSAQMTASSADPDMDSIDEDYDDDDETNARDSKTLILEREGAQSKQEQRDRKALKKSGDKLGGSPDSGKDRDSALSSSSSSPSDNVGGGGGVGAHGKWGRKESEGDQGYESRQNKGSKGDGSRQSGRDQKDKSGKTEQSGQAGKGDGKGRTDSTGRKTGTGGENDAAGGGEAGRTGAPGKGSKGQSKGGDAGKQDLGQGKGTGKQESGQGKGFEKQDSGQGKGIGKQDSGQGKGTGKQESGLGKRLFGRKTEKQTESDKRADTAKEKAEKQGQAGKGKDETDSKSETPGKGKVKSGGKGDEKGQKGLGTGRNEDDKGGGKTGGGSGGGGAGGLGGTGGFGGGRDGDKSRGKGDEKVQNGKGTGRDGDDKGGGKGGRGAGGGGAGGFGGTGGFGGGRDGDGGRNGMGPGGGRGSGTDGSGGKSTRRGNGGRGDGSKNQGDGSPDDELDILDSADLAQDLPRGDSRAGPSRSSSRLGGKGRGGKGTAWVGGGAGGAAGGAGGGTAREKEMGIHKTSSGSSGGDLSRTSVGGTTSTSTEGRTSSTTQAGSRTSLGTTVSFLPFSETSTNTRSSRRSGKLSSLASTRDDVTLPSMSSGFISNDDGGNVWRDSSSGSRSASRLAVDKGGRSSGGQMTASDKGSPDHLHLASIQVSPRPGHSKDSKQRQNQQERGGQRASTRSKSNNTSSQDRGDSTLTSLDIGDSFPQVPGASLESSRPPTNHRRRQGWQDAESARSRSRSPGPKDEQSHRARAERSQSDRLTESRSVRWQEGEGDFSMPGTAATESRRSVRWKQEGSSLPGESPAAPSTSRVSSQRSYTHSETIYTPTRRSWVYSSLSQLARIHRKKKEVAPLVDSDDMEERRHRLRRPSGMDDRNWKLLLEELYPDKKYLDYAKATSRDRPLEEEEYLHEKAGQGLKYLYGRAKFWGAQDPLVRPGTNMTVRSCTSATSSPTATSKGTPSPNEEKSS